MHSLPSLDRILATIRILAATLERKTNLEVEQRRHLCVLSTEVVESVLVVVRQSCRTLEADVAEFLPTLARLQYSNKKALLSQR